MEKNNRVLLVKDQFIKWCIPKRGKQNPETMTNIVWIDLIENNYWPYKAHEIYGTGDKQSPGWCFSREGQSETKLPDGSVIFIGGEHEDFYDEDFYIYNDVIVISTDGSISIYGYPKDVFPPTDSHSATLIGRNIYIIGCIGYPEQRNPDNTPVYILNLDNYSIQRFETVGEAPNWLYNHDANFSPEENAIYCKEGKIGNHVENIATWRLCISSGVWSCVKTKSWTRWQLTRKDNQSNNLYELGRVVRAEERGQLGKYDQEYKNDLQAKNYPLDLVKYRSRYAPPIEHVFVPNDEFKRHTISIDGVIVRFDEDQWDITVTVEGVLPSETISALKMHGIETFSDLEATEYKIEEL